MIINVYNATDENLITPLLEHLETIDHTEYHAIVIARDGKRRSRAGLGPGQSRAGLNWTLRPARDRLLKSPRPARPSLAGPGISVARPDRPGHRAWDRPDRAGPTLDRLFYRHVA